MILDLITIIGLTSCGGQNTHGTSDVASHVTSQLEDSRRHLHNSVALGLRGKGVFDELYTVAQECHVSDWDSQGAVPVDEDTYQAAYRFLEALPLGVAAPSIGAEPDGHLTFEWHRSPRRTLSVSVSPERELHYSALLGPREAYGTEPFFGDVPSVILDLIGRVVAQ
ncbi:conserved hypothetical protein [Verrucomicrobia bacterium]|nr:conserved hypothetical protein [Verrucomicrobiota bacterium]